MKTLKDVSNVDEALEILYSLEDPLNNRNFGAEINSIASLIDKGYLSSLQNAYFLVSDTDDGRFLGEVLKKFFKENPFGLEFNLVDYIVVEDLDDSRPYDFKARGLRNLVREMARLIRNHPGSMINATGGYKAQIAFATALGQALKVSVYYRFERFPQIIELPPLPLSLSDTIAQKYKRLLIMLECSKDGIPRDKFLKEAYTNSMASIDEEMKVLIETMDDIVLLSPMGQIYFESVVEFTYEELEKMDFLVSKKSPEEKISFSKREHHSAKLLKDNYSDILKVAKLKLVDKIIVDGSSTNYKTDRISAKVERDIIRLDYSTSGGTLHFRIFTKCYSEKINSVIAEKIEKILK